ncbi:MAG: 23S rRNA (guanosine(2251)-2'-O)-methyltransferase RlmB [Elusimicrobia bacterium CG08_land_8_20_14_0_20_51_18]|nr:MAG: 23S rRNA (guanosine(2251)-2'-O)-methyltransferase RlmB [Elusimicrobia bacterium CG08_land_8_20_14_0_20_51_18]
MDKKYIYGINGVDEAVKNGKRKIFRVIASKNSSPRIDQILRSARSANVYCETADKRVLDKLSNNGNHQGIMAEVSDIAGFSLDEAAAAEKDLKKARWVAIDSITDPSNLGSIIRSAVCFGFTAIIIPENRTVGITPAVERVASGALEKMNVIPVTNLNQTILELKKKNFWVYGADMSGENVRGADFAFPLVLVIGSEGEGLHLKTREHCDKIISIPQVKDFDSLNASVSAAVLMYEISSKRIF